MAAHPQGRRHGRDHHHLPRVLPFLTFARDLGARRTCGRVPRPLAANDAVLSELLELAPAVPSSATADGPTTTRRSRWSARDRLSLSSSKGWRPRSPSSASSSMRSRPACDAGPGREADQGDLDHYLEVLRRERFDVDEAEIRGAAFPNVIAGLLEVNAELFDLEFRPIPDAPAAPGAVRRARDDELIGRVPPGSAPAGREVHPCRPLPAGPRPGWRPAPAERLAVQPPARAARPRRRGDLVPRVRPPAQLDPQRTPAVGPRRRGSQNGTSSRRPRFCSRSGHETLVLRRFAVDRDGNRIPAELVDRMRDADRLGRPPSSPCRWRSARCLPPARRAA